MRTETIHDRCLLPDELNRATREELRQIQLQKLAGMLEEVLPGNGFYRRRFEAAGVEAHEIDSLEALRRLPLTTKAELSADQQAHPPFGTNLTYPIGQYIRMHQTSGTTGRPMRWLDTAASWRWIQGLWAIIFDGAGIRREDRFFFPFSFGPFLGFWAAFDAAWQLGYLTLPGGAMNTSRRLEYLIENEATVVCCTPTYALHMAEVAAAEKIDLAGSAVRALIVAGEPGGSIPETRRRIENAWGARVFDHSGMTEIGPMTFECAENPGGLHVIESEFIAEVVDAQSGEALGPGERGELIVTTLGRWGSPLIRYRTGDFVCVDAEACPCGRSLMRLKGGILGRTDDLVFIRGNNLYPSALEAVMRGMRDVAEYRAEVENREGLAELRLKVEPRSGSGDVMLLRSRVEDAVRDAFNFRPEVEVVEPGTLPRFELKASRFIIHQDERGECV